MIIERKKDEVVFRLSGDLNIDELQEFADYFEFLEISKNSKATQEEVDSLVKEIKKGRWESTKEKIDL